MGEETPTLRRPGPLAGGILPAEPSQDFRPHTSKSHWYREHSQAGPTPGCGSQPTSEPQMSLSQEGRGL